MSFEFREHRYYLGIWYVEGVGPEGPENWMGVVWRDLKGGDGRWHFDYRFRYIKDQDLTFQSKDRKSWYGSTMAPARGQPIEALEPQLEGVVDLMTATMVATGRYREPIWKIVCRTDDVKVISAALFKMPWAHRDARFVKGGTA